MREWRLRCAAPLFFACSEQLGGAAWLSSLIPPIQQAAARIEATVGAGAASGLGQGHAVASTLLAADWMLELEAHLFAGACTSPGCSWGGAATSMCGTALVHLSAHSNGLSGELPIEALEPHP